MKKLYILLLGMAFNFAACVEDEGSYDLAPINEVTFENIDKEDGYTVVVGDELVISPDVVGTLAEKNEEGRYTYNWFISTEVNAETGEKKIIPLGTERELHFTPTTGFLPTTYSLYLEVEDVQTGLKWLTSMWLKIRTQTTTGFLVLGNKPDGTMKLDMIAMVQDTDTLVVEDFFPNEEGFRNAQSLHFAGGGWDEYQTLWITDEEQSRALTSGSFGEWLEDHTLEAMMFTSFDVKRPMRVLDMFPHQYGSGSNNSSGTRGYITDDAMYICSMLGSGQVFGDPVNRYDENSEDLFKVYPLAFEQFTRASTSSYAAVFYDMTNDKFVGGNDMMPMSFTLCEDLKDNPTDAYPWNQAGTTRKLVFGQNGFKQYSYALMRDASDKWFVYLMMPSRYGVSKDKAYEIDPTLATAFNQASAYAFSSFDTRMVYAVGSKLYGYDYGRKQAALLKDFGTNITLLQAEGLSTGGKELSEFLLVTSNGDGKSVVRKVSLADNPDKIELEEDEKLVWEIDSNVVDIEWKNAGDLEDVSDYY